MQTLKRRERRALYEDSGVAAAPPLVRQGRQFILNKSRRSEGIYVIVRELWFHKPDMGKEHLAGELKAQIDCGL